MRKLIGYFVAITASVYQWSRKRSGNASARNRLELYQEESRPRDVSAVDTNRREPNRFEETSWDTWEPPTHLCDCHLHWCHSIGISNMYIVCARYQDAIKNNQAPHIVFDTTISGPASETVKSFTSALALPTVSASFGQEGDLRQWRDISVQKRNYLLQVMPP